MTEGFVRTDRIDFNAFNESENLLEQIESYRERFGYYPGRVLVNRIHWTRENRKWLKDRSIEIGGVPISRKTKRSKCEKEKERRKNNPRSKIEGKFGEGKRRYGLDRLMNRLPQTTKAEINLTLQIISIIKLVREISVSIFTLLLAYVRLSKVAAVEDMTFVCA